MCIRDRHLSEGEKRPWLKNVKIHMADDLFAIESFDPKKKCNKISIRKKNKAPIVKPKEKNEGQAL